MIAVNNLLKCVQSLRLSSTLFSRNQDARIWHSRLFSAKMANEADKQSPLKGIRILDLTRVLAGPYCSMILGDLGAEIIKVEKPGTGDDTRSWSPPDVSGLSCYFVSVNRNKQSIAIDLKHGSSIVKKLARECDVLIENYVPGTLEKYGLGYEDLRNENPGLIYCSITGYGPSGPYKSRGGYDVIAASIGGLLHITGPMDGEPCKVGVAMTDLATGLYAHGAILAALLQRSTTKLGQKIDCNLLSTQMSCLANLASNYLNAGKEAKRWGTAHESIVPYQTFRTKDDRWITIGAGNNDLFHELCDSIELSDLKNEPKFSTNASRVENRKELLHLIQGKLLTKPLDDWLKIFQNCKLPYGPVNNMEHAFADPQVKHNKVVQELGPYKVVGPAVKFSAAKNEPQSQPPTLGQHTREVLRNIAGISEQEIDELYSRSIVQ